MSAQSTAPLETRCAQRSISDDICIALGDRENEKETETEREREKCSLEVPVIVSLPG